MNKFIFAIGGLLAGMVIQTAVTKGNQQPLPNKTRFKFHCWLCSGETFFHTVQPSETNIIEKHDCKWCGMENSVSVTVSKTV